MNKHVQEVGILLTSSSDLHSSDYLYRRGPDAAGEECPGVVEGRYNNLGNPAAFIGHQAAGEKEIVETPLYENSLFNDQRAGVSDDTGSCYGRPQKNH